MNEPDREFYATDEAVASWRRPDPEGVLISDEERWEIIHLIQTTNRHVLPEVREPDRGRWFR